MRLQQPNEEWRWMSLIVVLTNVVLNYLPSSLLPGESIMAVTQKFNSLVTPAGYAFSIWGVIHLSMMVYAVYQLLPSQREEILHDHLARPLLITNLFAIGWLLAFRMEWIVVSTLMMVGMFTASVMLYIRVRDFILRDDYSNWFTVPFSLYGGWLCVMMVLNASLLFISLGLQTDVYNQVNLAILLILIVSLLGVYVGFRCGDFIFPVAIVWACIAIGVAQERTSSSLGAAALVGALIPIVWMVTTWLKRVSYHHKVRSNKFSF